MGLAAHNEDADRNGGEVEVSQQPNEGARAICLVNSVYNQIQGLLLLVQLEERLFVQQLPDVSKVGRLEICGSCFKLTEPTL